MNPLRLNIRNFMNHRKSDLDFENIKSALIVGKTKENDAISNGVGKSTIFSAIEWVLFNKVYKTTLDKVVRDGQKRCSVEFEFELGGEIYKIDRSLTSKGTKNIYLYQKINDVFESITQRTPTDTEEKLQEIIKISHKAFQYSVLFRQADLTGLTESGDGSETKPKMRIEILKEPMNLMRYSKKEKIALEKIRPIKKEIDTKESISSMLGNPEEDIKKYQEELSICLQNIEEKEKIINSDLTISLNEKKDNLNKLKATLSSSDADIHDKVEEQHKKVKKLNYTIKELGSNLELSKKTIIQHKESLNKKKSSINDIKNKLSELDGKQYRPIKEIKEELDKTSDDEVRGNKILARLEAEYDFAKQSIPDSDECSSCHQPITKEYRKEFEEKIAKTLENKRNEIEKIKTALTKCKNKKNRLSNELKEANQHINNVESIKKDLKHSEENVQFFIDSISKAESDCKKIELELNSMTTELQENMKQYNTLKQAAESSNLSELNSKIFALAREIKVYEQSISSMNVELTSLKTKEGVLKDRINTRTQDLEKLKTINDELISLRKNLAIHQRVANAFSHKGIPTFIINNCLNELQFETNKALQELRPDLEVQFDADLNFTYRRNGIEKDYHQLSHGQHVYIALALKRSLSRIIQRKMGIDIKALFFDEIDSPLDAAGVEALSHAIKKWQDEFKIFLVTHNQDLKNKFSHAIVIEEGDDGADATIKTSW